MLAVATIDLHASLLNDQKPVGHKSLPRETQRLTPVAHEHGVVALRMTFVMQCAITWWVQPPDVPAGPAFDLQASVCIDHAFFFL